MIKEIIFRFNGFFTLYRGRARRVLRKAFGNNADYFLWNDSKAAYKLGAYKIYWETLAAVTRYQNACISGDINVDPLAHTIGLIDKHCEGEKLVGLSIGCAESGSPEMAFCQSGRFIGFEVFDIAGDLLKQQAKVAASRGMPYINYVQKDLNEAMLKEGGLPSDYAYCIAGKRQ